MEIKDKVNYGSATVGYGTKDQREIPVKDYVRCAYNDNRLMSVSELENDEGFVLCIENPLSSGRNPYDVMRLSKKSLVGLMSAVTIYANLKGWNWDDLLREATDLDKINYSCSDNLKPLEDK